MDNRIIIVGDAGAGLAQAVLVGICNQATIDAINNYDELNKALKAATEPAASLATLFDIPDIQYNDPTRARSWQRKQSKKERRLENKRNMKRYG